MGLCFIRNWALSEHLRGHFPADVWENHNFRNRTWGKTFSTSGTVLKVLIFPTRLQSNCLRGGPKVPLSV